MLELAQGARLDRRPGRRAQRRRDRPGASGRSCPLIVPDIMRRGLLPDSSFDAVTLFQVLDHMPDPQTLLRDCRTDPAPGGGDPGPEPQRCRLVRARTRRAQPDRRRRAHLSVLTGDHPPSVLARPASRTERGPGQEHLFARPTCSISSPCRDDSTASLLPRLRRTRLGHSRPTVPLGNLCLIARRPR